MRKTLAAFVVLAFAVPAGKSVAQTPAPTPPKTPYRDLREALLTSFQLREDQGPRSVNWVDGGQRYSYLATHPGSDKDDIREFDPSTLQDKLVLDNSQLHYPGSRKPFSYESFQWSRDSKHIVFKTNSTKIYRRSEVSDFYVYSIESGALKLAARKARTAELSPDGSRVGLVRNGNLYVYDFAAGKESALTQDAHGKVFNGYYDWVYEEEFGKAQAWNWSPDSRYVAYWQFDESRVPVFQMTNFEGAHPEYERIPIPDPGDPNPRVRIGVVDVRSHRHIWLQPEETGDFYIPRIYWTSDPDVLALVTLNRAQNDMKLYFFNVRTGARKVVMEEKNETWVAIFNFYTQVDDMLYFPEHSREFFWVSDRSGNYHLYRYGYDGKLINSVTKGNWDLIKVTGIDEAHQTVYYLSAEASPLDQELYSVKFDGSGERQLTPDPGFHRIDMSPSTDFFIDRYSSLDSPEQVVLCRQDGKVLKVLADNKQMLTFVQNHAYAPTRLFRFVTSDGVPLDGSIVLPVPFDSTKRYPLVMSVYGGPESQDVDNSFQFDGWVQWLAQNGYIVADVNNRGTANDGRDFLKVVYRHLGKWESHDFVETARYLGGLPYVDSTRMAIMGTSYGGYSTTYTMLTHPGVFKVGIANSAVTDWRLYDDIYTERYMAPLKDNPDGYEESSDLTFAGNLNGRLLLIHSMSDDNVHPVHTMQLLTALTNAGKDADLRIYPLGAHGAAYNLESYLLIESVSFQYLEEHLKGLTTFP